MHKKDVIQFIAKKFGFVRTLIPVFLLTFFVVILLLSQTSQAAILKVGQGKPYSTIQSAINAAKAGDSVLVFKGTYRENIDFLGKAISVRSVSGPQKTVIDGEGSDSVVTFKSSEGLRSVLNGFTITNGTGTPRNYYTVGGGIYLLESSPSITNCIIKGNTAAEGAGIWCENSSPFITNCAISENVVTFWEGSGGGIFCYYSSPTITNCIISGNITLNDEGSGGGISCFDSSPTITNCVIRNNVAHDTAGIIISGDSSPTIADCLISNNIASGLGGGILLYFVDLPVSITNCTISNNFASEGGGGIICKGVQISLDNCIIKGNATHHIGGGVMSDYGDITITNCNITNNYAYNNGGGVYVDTTLSIVNSTISGNESMANGGALYCDFDSSVNVVNSIIWGNNAMGGYEEMYIDYWVTYWETFNISYSDIRGGWQGTGNIDADPLFVGNGDYHLTAGSPCIDTGTGEGAPLDDIDGDIRPQGNGYDMGADEYVPE